MNAAKMFKVQGKAASTGQLSSLVEALGHELPESYLKFLGSANGAECGPCDEAGDSLRILSSDEVVNFNRDYGVAESLPEILCFASDGGDRAFAFDRSSHDDENSWNIVLIELGDLSADSLLRVSESFCSWADANFDYTVLA